jgi:ribosome biogenesis SPOUT family RNA methylase Rps3
MTTDTAVRVTRMIIQEKRKKHITVLLAFSNIVYTIVPLEKIPYIDDPELHINKNESTEMPFRYVKGAGGEPIMPDVSPKEVYATSS